MPDTVSYVTINPQTKYEFAEEILLIFKDVYNVSLCKNGILGGLLYLKDAEMIYCTNKLTVPERIRRLHIPYNEISEIRKASLHTAIITMKNNETYKFFVFSRKNFLQKIDTKK